MPHTCQTPGVDLEAYELVVLRRAPDAPGYDDETLARIQESHLEFHARLRESGDVVTNGPLLDQPDQTVRGITFYRLGSLERARQRAEQDPAVLAGRLVVDVMTWWCPAGTMRLPGRPVDPDDD